MKSSLLFLCLFFNAGVAFSQDIIVLRKNEQEIQCRVTILNDSIVGYRLWKTADTAQYLLPKFQVLSYSLDKSNHLKVSPYAASVPGAQLFGLSLTSAPLKPEFKEDVVSSRESEMLKYYYQGETVDGYVILTSGDTVHGYISIDNLALNQLQVDFTAKDLSRHLYHVPELNGYGYHGVDYVKKKVYRKNVTNGLGMRDGTLFVHRVISGRSNLYYFYTLFFSQNAVSNNQHPAYYFGRLKKYYVFENAGQTVISKGKSLKGALNRAFAGDKVMLSKVESTPVEKLDIPALIKNYNSASE
jgi:hypothetical protein